MSLQRDAYEVVIIGGGVAGSALATVLARAGRAVLERSTVYRDRVRGELFQPWGVAEARRLGLYDALRGAGGVHHTRSVPYDETMEPVEAEAAAVALDKILPDVPGSLGLGHPAACQALTTAAVTAGARILRGIAASEVELGSAPTVRYRLNGVEHVAECRLIIGADGRESAVRRRAGIPLHAIEPRLLGAGLLIENLERWPEHQLAIGTEGDLVFLFCHRARGAHDCTFCTPSTSGDASPAPRVGGPFSAASLSLACRRANASPGQRQPAHARHTP
jgi:2-polyprenyl-6-methoxyphenol hydroxylase-like FAD-dependent oxidoreductase